MNSDSKKYFDGNRFKKKSSVFEKHYHDYLGRLASIDMASLLPILDIRMEGDTCLIPFFGEEYRISRKGIADASGNLPSYEVCVMLCRYLLNCPLQLPVQDDWVSFRDFKDAGPLTVFYRNSVEGLIVRSFAGNVSGLQDAARANGGHPPLMNLNYDVVMQFVSLPRIPLLCFSTMPTTISLPNALYSLNIGPKIFWMPNRLPSWVRYWQTGWPNEIFIWDVRSDAIRGSPGFEFFSAR